MKIIEFYFDQSVRLVFFENNKMMTNVTTALPID